MRLSNSDVRSIVLECLRKERPFDPQSPPYNVDHLCADFAKLAEHRQLLTEKGHNAWIALRSGQAKLHSHLEVVVRDVVWDLIIEGVLRPGGDERNMDYPWIHVTEHGKKTLAGNVTPHDPDRFLAEISNKVPEVDPIIVRYVAESAETLRRNCLLSSTVTLGCASEKAFLLVIEACENCLTDVSGSKFSEAIRKRRSIKEKHAEFVRFYTHTLKLVLKDEKSSDWLSGFEDALHFIFSYFRDLRNDAGHPTGAVFTRERVHSHLVIFPYYLRLVYDLIEWIQTQQPSSS